MIPISWTSNKITSKESQVAGNGVFALMDIEAGERVAVFGGFSLSFDDLENLKVENPEEYNVVISKGIQVETDIIFSPVTDKQFSHIEYLNHSCHPNVGFHNQLTLIAMRDILTGEEITMDYATCITKSIFDMDCECGSSDCRKTVTCNDWKITELQERYRGYFQPYIEKMITSLR